MSLFDEALAELRSNDGGHRLLGGPTQGLDAEQDDHFVTLGQLNSAVEMSYYYDDPAGNPHTSPVFPAGTVIELSGAGSGGSGESAVTGNGGGSAATCYKHLLILETGGSFTFNVGAGAAGVTGGDGNVGNVSDCTFPNGRFLELQPGGGANSFNGGSGGQPTGNYMPENSVGPPRAGGTTGANAEDAVEVVQGIWSGAGGGAGATTTYSAGAADTWPNFFPNSVGHGGCGAPSVWGGDDYSAASTSYNWLPTWYGAGSAGTDSASVATGTTRNGFWQIKVLQPSN